jgi:hypothetical protein
MTTLAPTPLRPELAAAAGYLGLDRAELRSRLQRGETLAALALERGRPLPRLIETMVGIARARLDAAVAAGRLTAAARDDIVADLRERIRCASVRAVPFPGAPAGPNASPVRKSSRNRHVLPLTETGV